MVMYACVQPSSLLAHTACTHHEPFLPGMRQSCPQGVKLVMEATCIMFDEKPKMVDDPNKIGKKVGGQC